LIKRVAIIIPIYKNELNIYEEISLSRCFNILKNHTIIIVAPYSLTLDNISILSQLNLNISFEYFSDDYFQAVDGYNKLMLSIDFYSRFLDYEYILIHQLDVYIFKDDLIYWCNKNFDYVGSPWIDFSYFLPFFESMFSNYLLNSGFINTLIDRILYKFSPGTLISKYSVGNGGFSLRKVDYFLNIATQHESFIENWKRNEDIFWSWYVPLNLHHLKRPDLNLSLSFGFDIRPDLAYKKINGVLPFGAHAWYRDDNHYLNNLSFWSNHIDEIKST
jgi:hypothetical protein